MYRLIVFGLMMLLAAVSPAQQVTGTITGSVVDPSGSAIAGAALTLVSESTAAVRTVNTAADGNFVFTAVTPGLYTVSTEAAGFKKLSRLHIELAPGDTLGLGNLRMEVGAVTDSITVAAEGAAIQTATAERSGIISSDEVQNLTVISRDFTSLAALQPGIVVNPGAEVQTFSGMNTINALGGRTTGNNVLIDGIPATNSNQSNMNTSISMDATQTVEVKVSNFSAEFGRNNGVTIMAVSKGGTQRLHGAAYYYGRNEALNANNYFNNQKGYSQTQYRMSNMGGNLGGPLRIPHMPSSKGKLFFFVSAEEIRELRPKAEQDVTVPTLLERKGDFSQSVNSSGRPISVKDPLSSAQFPGNIIPANRIVPSMQKYLSLFPAPNQLNTAITLFQYNYVFRESLNVPKRVDTGRLDYNLSEKTMMYGRFNYWWEVQNGAAVSGGNSSWGWLPQSVEDTTPSAVYSITHILNPSTVLQATMGFQRLIEAGPALNQQVLDARNRTLTGVDIPQFNPGMNPYHLVPAASFGGVTNSANPSYATRFPNRGAETTFNWNGTVSKTAGPHTAKAGIYAERWRARKGEQATFAGSMDFRSDTVNPGDTGYAYGNALTGTLYSYTESNVRPPMYEYTTGIEWFAQDSWRLSRKLTLEYGLRFGWGQPWHSVQNLEAGFLPGRWNPQNAVKLIQPVMATVNGKPTRMGLDPSTGQIVQAVNIGAIAPNVGDPYNGVVYRIKNPEYLQGLRETDGIKVAPRFGFAYDPTGRGRTVIRAGGGMFYNIHERDNYQSGVQYTPPIQTNSTIYYTTVDSFITSRGYLFPSNSNGLDQHRPIQRTTNFSFNVQQAIGFGTVLDVAYVGALGRHLVERMDINATRLGTNWQPQSLDSTNSNKALPANFLRPYPGFGSIWWYFNGGNSSYHSLQSTLRRRYKSNLTYGAVWTWSKTMDYADDDAASSGQTVTTQMSQKIWNYGKAGFDHTHIFRFYYSYAAPRIGRSALSKAILNGWQISGITTLQSGSPMGISPSFVSSSNGGPSSGDVTGSTDSGWRPLLIANPVLPRDRRSVNAAFNVNSVAPVPWQACQTPNAPAICWGNAPKDVFRGPGINNWDASLFKNFGLGERLRGQFRVEAYNVFNHTNFSGVNTSAQFDKNGVQMNALFGQYTAAQFPRRLQLAMRLTF